MARQGHRPAGIDVIAPDELAVLAVSRPRRALTIADGLLATSQDLRQRSYARQARGVALRELGDVRGAIRELRRALDEAQGMPTERQADIEASLGGALIYAGRTDQALQALGSAVARTSGVDAARIKVRLGVVLGVSGRPADSAQELRAAARVLRRAGDATWEVRALINLANPLIELGDTRRAELALARAESLQDSEQTFEAAMVAQNRGLVATLDGRIPEALAHFDVAERRYAAAGAGPVDLPDARAATLLAAGLFADALASAEQAVDARHGPGAASAFRAQALLRASEAALATGDPQRARSHADSALRLFRRQSRERGVTLARLGVARARHAAGERDRRLLREAVSIAADAGRHRMFEVIEANLLAGRLALDLHDDQAAALHLGRARRSRTGRSDLGKVLGWQAAALQARADNRRRVVLRCCEQGLDVLAGHQSTLGATEMRAAATTHGEPLARLAVAEAVASGDPRLMLHWVERWRATILRLPPVRSPDQELSADLARLRLARRRHDELRLAGRATGPLERDIANLEARVRNRSLQRGGSQRESAAARAPEPTELTDVLAALDGTQLVEIFRLDDRLHVLVASARGVRHHVAGSTAAALRAVELARFTLRRSTHRTAGARALATLPALRETLQRELLGPAADDLEDGAVLVVPPAALAATPWGLLPGLAGRSVAVMPSAHSWLTARRVDPGPDRTVSLIAGPRLQHAAAEIEQLARLYPAAQVLGTHTPATTTGVLAALDGAWLAHVAAHGTFRDDNPMFSSLSLDDGPLTVFDLQRLRRAPHRLVLSCCDTGTVSAAGSDEMLGLMSALAPLGTAGLLAAVVPVSDAAAVGFGTLIHERLRAGADTASALRDARLAADGEPAAQAIAHAFVAFGAV